MRMFARKDAGAVAIESAISMVLFTGIIFSACEFALVFLKAATAQYVLSREARDSLTSENLRNGLTADGVVERIRTRASAFGINADNWEISICPAYSPNCGTSDLGQGRDLLLLEADPKLKMLANSMALNFVASVLISREPNT